MLEEQQDKRGLGFFYSHSTFDMTNPLSLKPYQRVYDLTDTY